MTFFPKTIVAEKQETTDRAKNLCYISLLNGHQ